MLFRSKGIHSMYRVARLRRGLRSDCASRTTRMVAASSRFDNNNDRVNCMSLRSYTASHSVSTYNSKPHVQSKLLEQTEISSPSRTLASSSVVLPNHQTHENHSDESPPPTLGTKEKSTTNQKKKDSYNNNNPTPDFNDAQYAFACKTNTELIRAAATFGLCHVQPLVRHSERLLQWTRAVTGDRVTDGLLKATLFGHFCAGEDEVRIQPTIAKLEQAGIGSILDFAAEDDVETTPTTSSSSSSKHAKEAESNETSTNNEILQQHNPNVRLYDYESEAMCDRHVETFKQCIHSVSHLKMDGFAAIKVTALGNPKLLARMSRAIVEAQNLFAKFDVDGDGYISEDEFERGLDMFFIDNDDTLHFKQRVKDLMPTTTLSPAETRPGKVDYLTWSMLLAPHDLPKITSGCREVGPLALATPTPEEAELIQKMYQRGHALAREAAACGTRLLVDAEQARFQPAIDNLVLELQRTYNAATETDYPIIYNTYQCYLKDAGSRLRADVERSKRYNYHFGAKLVRGAYMESERALAASLGVPSPIHDTIQDTHQCYNDSVRFLLQYAQESEQAVELMCATHNQDTIEHAIEVMNELGIDRTARTISFAQLFGMKDNLTFNLGQHGFRAYKYVPYGPVKMVMPYLLRRANENSAITAGATKELHMIVGELSRRVFGKQRSVTTT